MHGISATKCPKCGRILYGVTLCYGRIWDCIRCTEDKTDTLHCEQGSKVVAAHMDYGTEYDFLKAEKFLREGQVYTVDKLWIGRSKAPPHNTLKTVVKL